MFNKDNANISKQEAETIIGPSVKVTGNFHGEGNIIIEGIVEGSVKTNNFLLVRDKAKITASVEALDAKIGGEITGDIKIKGYLEITKSAKIFGDIETSQISIEKGAIFDGHCIMIKKNNHSEEKN